MSAEASAAAAALVHFFGDLLPRHHADEEQDLVALLHRRIAVAEGVARRLPTDLVQYFRALQSLHISAEEGALHRTALRWLRPADRFTLARRMADRRTRRHAIVTPLP